MNIPSRIAFLGGGNMAGALINGLLSQGLPADQLLVVDIHEPTRERWATQGLKTRPKPDVFLEGCDIWVLAVKPQQLHAVTQAIRPFLKPDTLVISIAAGISLSSLSNWLGETDQPFTNIIRAMPNTPALVNQGVTGLAAGSGVNQAHQALATQVLESVGQVVWVVNDAQIDAVTAVSGSGPAYVFRFLESLIAGGVEVGLSADEAKALAIATVQGAVALAANSQEPIHALRENVTSKGGTTAAALDVLQSEGFMETIVKAVQAAHIRAAELSDEFGQI